MPLLAPSTQKKLSTLLFLTLVVGCGGSIGGGEEKSPESLRIINAAFDASEIHVGIGDAPIQAEVGYGEDSGYLEAPEGMVAIRVRKEEGVLPALSEELTITKGGSFTYLVTQDDEGVLASTLLTDNAESPKGGLFKIRFINAGSEDPVDFHLTLPGDDAEPPATAAAVAFKGASDYLLIDPASLHIHVTEAEETRDLVESETVSFETGRIYTVVFLEDEGGGKPFRLLVLTDK